MVGIQRLFTAIVCAFVCGEQDSGCTALLLAAMCSTPTVLQILIDDGHANIEAADYVRAPLAFCACFMFHSVAAVR